MPTVLRFGAYRVIIYPNDHPPPHVHIAGRGHSAIFHLNRPVGPAELRDNFGFSAPELREIKKGLAGKERMLYRARKEIHGDE